MDRMKDRFRDQFVVRSSNRDAAAFGNATMQTGIETDIAYRKSQGLGRRKPIETGR